ncbi:DDE_3 domain-containing protein [Trichonephila clavipes]|nr:DDE_3 domain-containing protein [Trichonephila clavipes]
MDRTRDPLTAPNVPEINHYATKGFMVRAGLTLDGRTHHVFERGTVSAVKYWDVLEPYFCTFRGAIDPDFILTNENGRSHATYIVIEFLKSEDICEKDWAGR